MKPKPNGRAIHRNPIGLAAEIIFMTRGLKPATARSRDWGSPLFHRFPQISACTKALPEPVRSMAFTPSSSIKRFIASGNSRRISASIAFSRSGRLSVIMPSITFDHYSRLRTTWVIAASSRRKIGHHRLCSCYRSNILCE